LEGKAIKPQKPMKTIEIFEINVANLKRALKEVEFI